MRPFYQMPRIDNTHLFLGYPLVQKKCLDPPTFQLTCTCIRHLILFNPFVMVMVDLKRLNIHINHKFQLLILIHFFNGVNLGMSEICQRKYVKVIPFRKTWKTWMGFKCRLQQDRISLLILNNTRTQSIIIQKLNCNLTLYQY